MEWISVDDSLPLSAHDYCAKFNQVFVLVTDGEFNISILSFEGGPLPKPWVNWSAYGDFDRETITHWMPLPELPQNEVSRIKSTQNEVDITASVKSFRVE